MGLFENFLRTFKIYSLNYKFRSSSRLKFIIGCIFLIILIGYLGFSHPSEKNIKDDGFLNQNIYILKRELNELKSLLKENQISIPETQRIPSIYIITPTYARPEQLAELNRLRSTFLHIDKLWWIVIEDSEKQTDAVSHFLADGGVPYTHLFQPTPDEWKRKEESEPRWKYHRGILQRNAGLAWIRQNCSPDNPAVLYFADDDNSYSVEIFEEMRWTEKVSVWPVGLVGGVMVERPQCDCTLQKQAVTGWVVGWKPQRSFPIDMAGFSLNVKLVLNSPTLSFRSDSERGFLETDFLSQIVKQSDLEPLADCCMRVLVWHMNAKPPNLNAEKILLRSGKRTDEGITV